MQNENVNVNEKYLADYAKFAVQVGVNVQKGQTLIIRAPIEAAHFARCCAAVAYGVGAREVIVHYNDEKFSRIKMEYTEVDVLEDVKPWILRSYLDYAEAEGGACILSIIARDPEIFKGLDGNKIAKATAAATKAMKPWQTLTMGDKLQWSIVAVPSASWASRVFPNLPVHLAEQELWKVIFEVCRVTSGDVVNAWHEHIAKTSARRDRMNDLNIDTLHLTSKNGTDLHVGLADGAIWEGAQSQTPEGYKFIANIPTEEVFTAPHRLRTNGIVYGTKPYVYNGNIIDGFCLTFKDGVVVDYDAYVGKEFLAKLLETDEGALHIGEVALVAVSSPINKSGILFFNTLFDENAACHLALGKGYPGTVQGGNNMSTSELVEKGVNDSLIHEDIMVGSPDMKITGITKDNETVTIFENGEWAF